MRCANRSTQSSPQSAWQTKLGGFPENRVNTMTNSTCFDRNVTLNAFCFLPMLKMCVREQADTNAPKVTFRSWRIDLLFVFVMIPENNPTLRAMVNDVE